ncbi:MAG TPA: hypothetical protein VG738_07750 [Chitinophagaceae bacterium]|nr:hypothetical protein [Chitinophagaceae bacterium]
MFASSESPQSITPSELDNYLARGWFRMNQTIFTTHFLHFNSKFYSAVWLRINISEYTPSAKHLSALKGIKNFTVEIKPAQVTRQHEILYEKYKTNIKFDAYSTLHQLLSGGRSYNIYNTWQVNICDRGKLIACGFFDTGKTSAEGIVSIYHPAYKKYSLGKCLIYTKIDYCTQNGLQYFYPGYVVPGYDAFDYKLGIGAPNLEYYNKAIAQWVQYYDLQGMYNPLADMHKNLAALQKILAEQQVNLNLLHYLFFDAKLNINFWNTLLDYPVFLLINAPGQRDIVTTVVIYNITTKQYVLTECIPVYTMSDPSNNTSIFSSDVLNIHKEVYAEGNAGKMAYAIKQYIKPPAGSI